MHCAIAAGRQDLPKDELKDHLTNESPLVGASGLL